MGPGKPVQYIPPQEHRRMRAKLNTKYVTAGLVYELDVWTEREIERRRQIFNQTRPHHGDDLIAALEYEAFITDSYIKR